jgi:type IX secretion system PorP/SprF family membrane protein
MKKILIILTVVTATFQLAAQDESVYNHYLINKTLVNPAFAGALDQHQVFLNMRSQWVNFPGAPKTYSVSYNGPVLDKIGIGALIMSENIASINKIRAQLAYAYHYKTRNLKLGMGFSTEIHRTSLSNDVLRSGLIDKNPDNLLNDAISGRTYFDATVGIQGLVNDRFMFSIALPTLIRARLNGIGVDTSTSNIQKSTFLRQVNIMGGYKIKTNDVTLEPSIMLRKSYNAPLLIDFNLMASLLDDKIKGGITFRPSYALAFSIGTRISKMLLFYSYEVSTQKFQQYSSGTHEITLGFDFEAKIESKSPRGRKQK